MVTTLSGTVLELFTLLVTTPWGVHCSAHFRNTVVALWGLWGVGEILLFVVIYFTVNVIIVLMIV